MIVGTAGHVDHGKTTLIRALTGVDTDRLPEEKRRGMTIELGYAFDGPLGFIDVPGHERFVHTMLAGAGGIDAALLVVAADDGVKPQTLEHLAILDLLGVESGVIAISRADLAPDRIDHLTVELRRLLAGTALRDCAVHPVSAITGAGIPALREALRALGPKPRDLAGYPRLAIDRAFTIAGAGLVVTGTLVAGEISVGDRLVLSPSDLPVRVRSLHAQNQLADRAVAGERVALNIAGAEKALVARGDWVLHPAIHAPTRHLDIQLRLLPGARALKSDTPVHLHLAASHVAARAAPLAGPIAPGETGWVRLTLATPIGALAGDRLVLRDASASNTIGGGQVLDPAPPLRGARTPGRVAQLPWLARPAPAALAGLLDAGWVAWVPFAQAHNVRDDAARADAVLCGGYALRPSLLETLANALTTSLATLHRAHPELPGLAGHRLIAELPGKPPRALALALIERAVRAGTLRQDGAFLCLAAHRAQLSQADQTLWDLLRDLLAADRFRPPRVRDLAPLVRLSEPLTRAALRRFARLSWLVEVAPDHFFLRETLAEALAVAARLDAEHSEITAAAYRDTLGNGRKVAIQLLEFFDSQDITFRRGDIRHIRQDRLDRFGTA